jgi:alpha-L-arabinofuranosidase
VSARFPPGVPRVCRRSLRFGTHEFVNFCRLIGAEPYLAANVGSGTPDELREWEYTEA